MDTLNSNKQIYNYKTNKNYNIVSIYYIKQILKVKNTKYNFIFFLKTLNIIKLELQNNILLYYYLKSLQYITKSLQYITNKFQNVTINKFKI